MWTIVAGPREYSPDASDCALGWAYEMSPERLLAARAFLAQRRNSFSSRTDPAKPHVEVRELRAGTPVLLELESNERARRALPES